MNRQYILNEKLKNRPGTARLSWEGSYPFPVESMEKVVTDVLILVRVG